MPFAAEYFDNAWLQGDPMVVRVDLKIDFDWGHGAVTPYGQRDYVLKRWLSGKVVRFSTDVYTLYVFFDDARASTWTTSSSCISLGERDLRVGRQQREWRPWRAGVRRRPYRPGVLMISRARRAWFSAWSRTGTRKTVPSQRRAQVGPRCREVHHGGAVNSSG